MARQLTTVPLVAPAAPAATPADYVAGGPPIPPIERIRLFSPRQWEEFVAEWADSLREEYELVERCGGAGDMGRDVIAHSREDAAVWDNYQCKHYAKPIGPSDAWIELGKLVYYTYAGKYTYPRRYYFVAPQGVGTTLARILERPDELRRGLAENWNSSCRGRITETGTISLEGALRQYLNGLDFSIFKSLPPVRLLAEHSRTRWHVFRFGGGLPLRPRPPEPPEAVAPDEATYVRALLDAYAEYLKRPIGAATDLVEQAPLQSHYSDSRTEFYSAESLRAFSRDTLPPDEFERLQDEVHSGVRDDIRSDHPDGYRRVVAVVKTARSLNLSRHALVTRLSVRDYGGICHQLANDGRVKWVR